MERVPMVTEWISALSSFVSALAVVGGVFFASRQLDSWRNQSQQTRSRELAEEIWANAHKILDAFYMLRNPLSQVPISEVKNRTYIYERRLSLLREKDVLFDGMRELQIRAKSILREPKVDNAIDAMFAARAELVYNLEEIIELQADVKDLDADSRTILVEARKIAFGRFDTKDEFGTRLNEKLSILEALLGPVTRLSKS